MAPQTYHEYLSREIKDPYRKVLEETLHSVKNIDNIPGQVDRMVKMIEGQEGFLGVIASAFEYKFVSDKFSEQIKELDKNGYIPKDIVGDLNFLRTRYNLSKHNPIESGRLTITDVETIRDHIVRVIDWFHCECPKGPHLSSIFLPKLVLNIQIGHLRTIIGLAEVTSKGLSGLRKYHSLSSEDFFRKKGFLALCATIDQYLEKDNVDGIAISMCVDVEVDGIIKGEITKNGWPSRVFKELSERYSDQRIIFINDAVAFARGCDNTESEYPILVLTMGNGIGCAIIEKQKAGVVVRGIDLSLMKIRHDYHVHKYLGENFFSAIAPELDWKLGSVRARLSQRMAKVLGLIREKHNYNSVIIGGGRSHFLDEKLIRTNFGDNKVSIQIQSDEAISLKGLTKYWHQIHLAGK